MLGLLFFSYSRAELVTLALLAVLVAIVAVMAWRVIRASRLSQEELERRRRSSLSATGKMGDATVVDVWDDLIIYSYDVRGIEYTASQDISALKEVVGDPQSTIGPVAVKYDVRNPANSIVVAEEWSGIRSSAKS
jgi:hypothetical protein